MPTRRSTGSGLKRRVMRRRRWWWLAALLVLTLLVLADRAGWLLVPRGDDLAAYHGLRARVVRVIDGDTLDIDRPDPVNRRPVTRVRLWGLDCPERGDADRPAEPLADEATSFAREFIGDAEIILHLESHRPRGTFGRVLAHVEVPGKGSLNLALLEAGLARADERWSHVHLSRYAKAERQARQDRIGLWAPAASD